GDLEPRVVDVLRAAGRYARLGEPHLARRLFHRAHRAGELELTLRVTRAPPRHLAQLTESIELTQLRVERAEGSQHRGRALTVVPEAGGLRLCEQLAPPRLELGPLRRRRDGGRSAHEGLGLL